MKRGMALSFLKGFAFFLVFRLSSLLLSLPAWVLLILHFAIGLSIWWFIGYVIAWFVLGLLRYLLIVFARSGAKGEKEQMNAVPNKNPYSHKDPG